MAKAKRPRPPKATPLSQRGKAKRQRKDEDLMLEAGDEADAFHMSDADVGVESDEDAGNDLAEETAEEKKLRIAKAYLQQLRQAEAAEASGSDDDEATRDAVAERLRGDALDAIGQLQRRIAHRLRLPQLGAVDQSGQPAGGGRITKCHRLPVTAVALTADDATAYSVSKDGAIMATDVETGKSSRFQDAGAAMGRRAEQGAAEWVAKSAQRGGGAGSLLAAAVSSDGRYLAVGGGDRKVHVWDARSRDYVQGFVHHKDIVTGLAFREGTHELYSGSFDRTVKIWSLDDRAYVDTLFGHQSEVLAVDALRAERVLTSGQDHTCRVWKVPEESQLIFRGYGQAIDCCSYVTGTEWVSGSSDGNKVGVRNARAGSLALWSQMKKKPVSMVRGAHATGPDGAGAGGVGGDCASWVSAVACCRGTDLVASGAGDGVVRLWALRGDRPGARKLAPLGGLSARGFVNALQIARSGRFLVAGVGQEPRLGRWARDGRARNGLLTHRLPLADE